MGDTQIRHDLLFSVVSPRKTKISYLSDPIFVHQNVLCLQVQMPDMISYCIPTTGKLGVYTPAAAREEDYVQYGRSGEV